MFVIPRLALSASSLTSPNCLFCLSSSSPILSAISLNCDTPTPKRVVESNYSTHKNISAISLNCDTPTPKRVVESNYSTHKNIRPPQQKHISIGLYRNFKNFMQVVWLEFIFFILITISLFFFM